MATKMLKQVGQRILEGRRRLGINQEEFAARIGISKQALSKIEQSKALPRYENLDAIATLLGMQPWEILMPVGATEVEDTANRVATLLPLLSEEDLEIVGALIRRLAREAGQG